MNTARGFVILFAGCSALWATAACSSTPEPQPAPAATPPETTSTVAPTPSVDVPPAVERREMSAEDCTAKGGTVVGDIGDGAVHKPEYRCPSGSPPIGRVPSGIEGSVCCT
jgi:hypothetical protein